LICFFYRQDAKIAKERKERGFHKSFRTAREAIVEAKALVIAELRPSQANQGAIINELREGQAMLAQILADQREQNAEFRRTANATLDRIDRQARGQVEPVRREQAHLPLLLRSRYANGTGTLSFGLDVK
jgi:CHAT domain-containing protein